VSQLLINFAIINFTVF